ncbi:MAG: hypothetical protein GY774_32275 [Planctomycetes bacterium]|nr:hypothetical protein [Planctomycetota bacterium]
MKKDENNNVETLDYYVKKALSFLKEQKDKLELPESKHTLVVGSQTGLLTGRIIYRFSDKSFSHAKEVLAQCEIDAKKDILAKKKILKEGGDVTIVSASGSRQVVPIARYALKRGLRVNAILCKNNSDLENDKKLKGKINFIKIEQPEKSEPPTVNTVTYGAMIQALTNKKETISKIQSQCELLKEPKGGYGQFKAFTVILPDRMPEVAEMIDWKLRGEKIGRCIGSMATHLTNFMHGAAITDAKKELYIALGLTKKEKEVFNQVLKPVPKKRKHYIDVPRGFGPLGFMMLGYSVVGQIQKKYPSFQNNVEKYGRRSKKWKWLSPIIRKKK